MKKKQIGVENCRKKGKRLRNEVQYGKQQQWLEPQ